MFNVIEYRYLNYCANKVRSKTAKNNNEMYLGTDTPKGLKRTVRIVLDYQYTRIINLYRRHDFQSHFIAIQQHRLR